MRPALFIYFTLMAIFLLLSIDMDSMRAVDVFWRDHNSRAAFKAIIKANDDGKILDAVKLTDLTGVRKIDRIINGKGDEEISFVGDDFVVLAGFTGTLRIGRISSRKIIAEFPAPATPFWDRMGTACYKGENIYYVRKEGGTCVLYEFNLRKLASRPLGDFPFKSVDLGYDESLGLMQFRSSEKILATFDLEKGKKIDYSKPVKTREPMNAIKVDAITGSTKLILSFNEKRIEMPYPRDEYVDGGLERDLKLDNQHPDSILVKSLWYPGLKILLDIKNQRSLKIFMPSWLDPEEELVRWKLIDGKLYLWRQREKRSGLYEIDLGYQPSFAEFCGMIKKYKLIKE